MVAPNPIDFDAALKGFTDIASNPVVFATVITIFGLYFVGVIWARWKDKKDLEKVTLVLAKFICHLRNSHQMMISSLFLITTVTTPTGNDYVEVDTTYNTKGP